MRPISGSTRIVGMLADPISHVRAPQALNRLFASQSVDAVVVPVHVTLQDLQKVVAGLRHILSLNGFIVTVPHKQAMATLCDRLGPQAALAGTVNAVKRMPDGSLFGETFDGVGFVEGMRAAGIPSSGQDILIVGAGGAASAIAFALASAGAARVSVTNRDKSKAVALVRRLQDHYPNLQADAVEMNPSGRSIIINATSLGLKPDDPLPIPPEKLDADSIVAEVIMQPARTKLLEAAEARGCKIHEGRHMLDAQLSLLGTFFTS